MRLVLRLLPLIALPFTPVGNAHAQGSLERGAYLAESIMACANCHSPRDAKGQPVSDKPYAGRPTVLFSEVPYRVWPPNISQDEQDGIGGWTDEDIKRSLVDGMRPDKHRLLPGVPLANVMPYNYYKVLTVDDLNSVIAYVKTFAPVKGTTPPPEYKSEQKEFTYPGADKPMSQDDLRDPVKRGLYLVSIGHCMNCHAERGNDDSHNLQTGIGKGGRLFSTGAVSPNISSHEKGLKTWTDAEIKRALTEGVSRDGRRLRPPMAAYVPFYRKMKPDDIDAIVAYLRTIPPVE